MVKLGMTVIDRISGFRGVVTGRAEYLSGCTQCLLGAKVRSDGSFVDSKWFDEQRLEVQAGEPIVVLDNSTTPGCDLAAPKR